MGKATQFRMYRRAGRSKRFGDVPSHTFDLRIKRSHPSRVSDWWHEWTIFLQFLARRQACPRYLAEVHSGVLSHSITRLENHYRYRRSGTTDDRNCQNLGLAWFYVARRWPRQRMRS